MSHDGGYRWPAFRDSSARREFQAARLRFAATCRAATHASNTGCGPREMRTSFPSSRRGNPAGPSIWPAESLAEDLRAPAAVLRRSRKAHQRRDVGVEDAFVLRCQSAPAHGTHRFQSGNVQDRITGQRPPSHSAVAALSRAPPRLPVATRKRRVTSAMGCAESRHTSGLRASAAAPTAERRRRPHSDVPGKIRPASPLASAPVGTDEVYEWSAATQLVTTLGACPSILQLRGFKRNRTGT